MKQCPECNKVVSDHDLICTSCGYQYETNSVKSVSRESFSSSYSKPVNNSINKNQASIHYWLLIGSVLLNSILIFQIVGIYFSVVELKKDDIAENHKTYTVIALIVHVLYIFVFFYNLR